MVFTVEAWVERADPAAHRAVSDALVAWREQHAADIEHAFKTTCREGRPRPDGRGRRHVAVVTMRRDLRSTFPDGVGHRAIEPLEPRDALAADVWDGTYDLRGVTVHGTKHFEPGQTVYFHGMFSGDGFERAYATGIHRESRKYVTVMCATDRFVRWRRERVTDPVAIYHLQFSRGYLGRGSTKTLIDELAAGMNARVARERGDGVVT